MKKYNLPRELRQLIILIITCCITTMFLESDFNIFNWSKYALLSFIVSVIVSYIIVLIKNTKTDLKELDEKTAETFLRILNLMKNENRNRNR